MTPQPVAGLIAFPEVDAAVPAAAEEILADCGFRTVHAPAADVDSGEQALRKLAASAGCVITLGGLAATGAEDIGTRTGRLGTVDHPGLVELIRRVGYESGHPQALLERPAAVLLNRTLVCNLPAPAEAALSVLEEMRDLLEDLASGGGPGQGWDPDPRFSVVTPDTEAGRLTPLPSPIDPEGGEGTVVPLPRPQSPQDPDGWV